MYKITKLLKKDTWHSAYIPKNTAYWPGGTALGTTQYSVSVLAPTQSIPPFCDGGGFVQVLLLLRDPPLKHVVEHSVQFVHSVNPPSTKWIYVKSLPLYFLVNVPRLSIFEDPTTQTLLENSVYQFLQMLLFLTVIHWRLNALK